MIELRKRPDGSYYYLDTATGREVSPDWLLTQAGQAPATPTTPTGTVTPPGLAAPPLAAASPTGATGLPADPLGNGPTVSGSASLLPAAGTAGSSTTGYDGGYTGSYDNTYYRDYDTGGWYEYPPEPPRYGNNTTHPWFGGDSLLPGGALAQPGVGTDYRQQVSVPGGATAGPYAVRAAESPSRSYGGDGNAGGSGGGGGIAKDLYWQFANKIGAKLSGQSSTYGDYEQERFKPYRGPDDPRTMRRVEKLDPRMRGPYAKDWNADMARTLYDNPQAMIGRVAPNLVNDSLLEDRLQSLPMAQLALISGSGKRGWQGGLNPMEDVYGDYYQKLNKRLENGRQGIDYLPFYRKQLRRDRSLSDYTNTLGGLYDDLAGGQVFDTDALFGNLYNPAKKTYLSKAFKPDRSGNNVAGMGDTFLSSYNAILETGGYGDIQREVMSDRASDLVNDYYAKYAGRKPKKAPRLNQWVGQQLGGY